MKVFDEVFCCLNCVHSKLDLKSHKWYCALDDLWIDPFGASCNCFLFDRCD